MTDLDNAGAAPKVDTSAEAIEWLAATMRDLADERDDLRAIIAEFRDIRMTVVYPPDDQDGEPQAVMDLQTWQAWQDDARASLANTTPKENPDG